MKITDQLELIKGIKSRNRIVFPPMDTYRAVDGFINDFHIQHYGARAFGGVGTIIVESTAIMPTGRIRPGDLGLWDDELIEGHKRVTEIVKQGGAVIGVQLGHSGGKGVLGVAQVAATRHFDSMPNRIPVNLATKEDLVNIEEAFISAAHRAKKAGYQFIEVHGAHGYFLSEIISSGLNEICPNKNIVKRSEMVIRIIDRIKSEVGIPVGIRLSFGDDNTPNRMDYTEMKPLIEALESKVEYFHVSSGETTGHVNMKEEIEKNGVLFRIPMSKDIKSWTKKPVIVVGNFMTRDDVLEALSEGVDSVAIGKANLMNPNLTLTDILITEEVDDDIYSWGERLWYKHSDIKKRFDKTNK